jgi:chromosome segregation ATPase
MITLVQIRTLESRVAKAVELVMRLKSENNMLTDKLTSYQKRISEFEEIFANYKNDQGEIESGILSAISQLDKIEEEFMQGDNETKELQQEKSVANTNEPALNLDSDENNNTEQSMPEDIF